MFPDDYNLYQFVIDVVVPIATLVIGLFIESKWHLMSDGVSYKLGILSGRLRGHEKEVV